MLLHNYLKVKNNACNVPQDFANYENDDSLQIVEIDDMYVLLLDSIKYFFLTQFLLLSSYNIFKK